MAVKFIAGAIINIVTIIISLKKQYVMAEIIVVPFLHTNIPIDQYGEPIV